MAEIDQIQVGDDTYDIRDSTARQRTVPSGGSTGQYLKKKSATSYDTEWGSFGSLAEKDTADWTNDVSNKPTAFPPSSHTHDDRYYTESEVNSLLAAKANTADLGGLADKDKVDWDTDIDDIPQSFPPSSHTHDDRYYTESETNSLLNGKANTSHNHDGVYAPSSHTHDDRYYTETEIDTKLADKADSDDLGELADHDTVDWDTEVTGKPTLGTMSAVNDAPSDSKEYVRKNGAWAEASGTPTIELYNSSTVTTISAGSIVTAPLNYDPNDYRLRMIPAGNGSTGQLYVLSEDCPPQTSVLCYYAPGTVCPVLCDTDAVALGDILGGASGGKCHSLEPSASSALPLGRATVGIALEAKASGSDGMVMTRLVDNPTTYADKENNLQTEYGTCFMVTENDGYYIKVAPVTKGKIPFGVQANKELTGSLLLHTRQNEQVAVLADETKIQVGDWLVPSATMDGYVRNGTGYGIGEALTSKAAGASGLVKVHLNLKYGISPRAWWIVGSRTEDDVIAVYQFVDRPSEANALININDGLSYPLAINGNGITWSTERGFYFPATNVATLLGNDSLFTNPNILSVSFGFSGVDVVTNNRVGVGVVASVDRAIYSRAYGYDSSYINFPAMNETNSGRRAIVAGEKYPNGVLSGNWKAGKSELFYNGQMLSVTVNTKGFAGTVNVRGMGNWTSINHTEGYMTACVIYSTNLSADEHLELANNIRALGGAG